MPPSNNILPFRFDDAAVATLAGQQRVLVDDRVELATTDPGGLRFQSHGVSNALVVPGGTMLTISFPGRAWDLYLGTATFGSVLTVESFAADASRGTQVLAPGQQANRRTRGLDRVEVTGDGGITQIGYRLVDAPYKWSLLGHRSLPVSDPAYPDPAKPTPGGEAAEAESRLTPDARAHWSTTYGPGFTELLRTFTALAQHQPTPTVPNSADPDDPRFGADYGQLLRTALVDPHIGRIAGLAWDDVTAAALPQLLAYKVVGRWRGGTFTGRPGDPALADLGPDVRQASTRLTVTKQTSTYDADLGRGVLEIGLGAAVDQLVLTLTSDGPLEVVALDAAGTELDRQAFTDPAGRVGLTGSGIARVELHGGAPVSLASFRWRVTVVERYGLIPGISPPDPGPPAGPTWLTATQSSPTDTRRVEGRADWETVLPSGTTPELVSVGVQVGGLRIGGDPLTPQPSVPPLRREYLLRDGGVAITPPTLVRRPSPRVLMRDAGPSATGLADGWYAWWVRGVDLFGRCSPPTPPATLAVVNAVPPPPPMLVLAEQVQADLPDGLVTVLGRSPLAMAWLAAHPGADALACCLAWTPELAALAPDVDAFAVYVRQPLRLTPADPRDSAETYAGVPWGTAVGSVGPVLTRVAGAVTATATRLAPVTVTAVAAEPTVDAADSRRYLLTTDLSLDTGSGELTGAVLTSTGGGANGAWGIAGNGEGATASLLVTGPAGAAAPVPGTYELAGGTSRLLTIAAGIAVPVTGDAFRRAYGGVLVVAVGPTPGAEHRYRVLGVRGGTLVCTDRGPDEPGPGAPAPGVGAEATWYPAWVLTIADIGFGPVPGGADPVGRAQVAATAIRRSGTPRRVESAPSTPATVLAVDTTVPATPVLPEIPAGDHCAQLATAADWYGISRFTLTFTPGPASGTSSTARSPTRCSGSTRPAGPCPATPSTSRPRGWPRCSRARAGSWWPPTSRR